MVSASIYTRRLHRQPIKSFCLRCHDNTITAFDVVMWLIDAAERGIAYLDVHLPDTPKFASCVFNFRNLVVLKLIGIHFILFVSAHLPLLRTLHLNKVNFFKHDAIIEILNACPILEDLVVKNWSIQYWSVEYDGECKSLPNLVRADITNLSAYDVHLEAFYNVKFLRLKEMFGCVPVFSNLTHLEIVYGRGIGWSFIFRVLENCPILQSFVLEIPLTPDIYHLSFLTPDIYHICFPTPRYLPECLSLQFKECTVTNYRRHEHEVLFVQHILLISTALETMRVYGSPLLNSEEKLEAVEELMAFPRSSSTCEVYFE
ncbi:FBD-associated F-box protein At4g10400-like [Trifolium pratense]|uniref:FBD-associated F-box protein At4g10400-like n=1 Tax=Trifolium pratense TaxID=57577 RepID=UPI001E69297B|nr:FBD-associated F-box protein At4g10400-like [Trifolium pratense]